jgi:hypothetical protein
MRMIATSVLESPQPRYAHDFTRSLSRCHLSPAPIIPARVFFLIDSRA